MEHLEGYILLHRTLLNSEIWLRSASYLQLWIFCLLKANWKDTGKLSRGQFYINWKKECEETKFFSENIVYHFLKWARNEQMLSTKRATRGMVVTICNYEEYQSIDYPACRHRADRNINKVINNINISPGENKTDIFFSYPDKKWHITAEARKELFDTYGNIDLDHILFKTKSWLLANSSKKKKNFKKFLYNWISRSADFAKQKNNKQPFIRKQIGKEQEVPEEYKHIRGIYDFPEEHWPDIKKLYDEGKWEND